MIKNLNDFLSILFLVGCSVYALRVFIWSIIEKQEVKKTKHDFWSLLSNYADNTEE